MRREEEEESERERERGDNEQRMNGSCWSVVDANMSHPPPLFLCWISLILTLGLSPSLERGVEWMEEEKEVDL